MSDANQSSIKGVPNGSEAFGSVPNSSEDFRTIPNGSEPFRIVRNGSERNENHTLTVREAARLFEDAGVARTERSIINWCQANPQGVARLDAYYDVEARRWFITPVSVRRVISEELAKATRMGDSIPKGAEGANAFEHGSEKPMRADGSGGDDGGGRERLNQLEKEVLDLRILNGGKDYLIEQFRTERDGFLKQLVEGSRRIGQLESELKQLQAPGSDSREAQIQ